MAKTRDLSQIQATDLEGLKSELNFILQRLTDRLDKLEGLGASFSTERGGEFADSVTAPTFSVSDASDVLHSLGKP